MGNHTALVLNVKLHTLPLRYDEKFAELLTYEHVVEIELGHVLKPTWSKRDADDLYGFSVSVAPKNREGLINFLNYIAPHACDSNCCGYLHPDDGSDTFIIAFENRKLKLIPVELQ